MFVSLWSDKTFSHSCLWSCTDYPNRPTSAGSLVYFYALELWLMFVHCVFSSPIWVHIYKLVYVDIKKQWISSVYWRSFVENKCFFLAKGRNIHMYYYSYKYKKENIKSIWKATSVLAQTTPISECERDFNNNTNNKENTFVNA